MTPGKVAARDGLVQVSVRVPRELVDALREKAEDEDRTLSAELRRIVRHHVERHGKSV